VIKADEWPTLMGMKWLALNWCFTLWIEGERRGNMRGMWCGAWGSGSMAGQVRVARGTDARPAAAVPALFSTGRKKKAG
jgi:hypothetical protein